MSKKIIKRLCRAINGTQKAPIILLQQSQNKLVHGEYNVIVSAKIN